MIARHALSLCILVLFVFLPLTNTAPAQESNTAQRLIRDVLIGDAGSTPVIETGSGGALVSQGSWTAPKGVYRDPLGNVPRPSDHDLRVLIPDGMNQAEALQFYRQTRARVASRVRAKFGKDAERVLRSINIYPPEQLMAGVTTEAEAIERLSKLGIGTPNLGGLPPEGLWTEGRFPFARGYERTTGRIFYNQGGKMKHGFADIVSDIVSGSDDAVAQTLVGASQNTVAFAQKVAHAVEAGQPEDAIKNLQRTRTHLGKSFGLAGETSSTSYLDDLIAKVKSDPVPLSNPTLRQEILEAMNRATLEARLLEKLKSASVADKELITRWLKEIRTGGTTGQKIMAFFGKLPLDKIALGLNTIFTFYQGYVIAGKVDEGDIEGALRESLVWVAFEAIGIGRGMMVMMANLLIEQAKSFGYDLMASTQDCEDLLAGVFTVRGREVNVLDDKVRPLTVDDLVAMYQRPQDLEGAIEYRAHHAASRGLGQATGKSDREIEKRLNDRCKSEILYKWTTKRMDLDRAFMSLYSAISTSPVSIEIQPDPAVLPDDGKPILISATMETPLADIVETQKKMKEILDKLAGKHAYTVSVRYEWQLDGTTLRNADRQTIDFPIGSAGDHTLYGEMNLHIYSGMHYGRSYRDVKLYKMTTIAVTAKKGPPEQKDVGKKDDPKEGDPKDGKPAAGDQKEPTLQTPPVITQPDHYTKGQIGGVPGQTQTGATTGTDQTKGQTGVTGATGTDGKVSGTPGTTGPVGPVPPAAGPGTLGTTGIQTGITSGVSTGVGTTTGTVKAPPAPPPGPPACTYEYSAWGECNRGTKTQTRTVTARTPAGCVEKGKPTLQKACQPPPTEEEKRNIYLNCLCRCSSGWAGHIGVWYDPEGKTQPECKSSGPCIGGIGAFGCSRRHYFAAPNDCAKSCYEGAYGKGSYDEKKADAIRRNENRKFKEPLTLKLNDKCPVTAQWGDIITLTASVEGGIPPHTYSWSGNGMAKDNTFTFANTREPGPHPISVTVRDDDGGSATATCTVNVEAMTVKIELLDKERKIPIGESRNFRGTVMSGDKPARGDFYFLWQPHPEIAFSPFEKTGGNLSGTRATFNKLGNFTVWVVAHTYKGNVKTTVGESEQITIEVAKPELKLSFQPPNPRVGQEVRLTVAETPRMDDKAIAFWWEIKGEAANPGPAPNVPNNRVYSFRPKDSKPVTVTVHGKAKEGGDDLGQASATVTAQAYEVSIGEPRRRGPKPRIWNPQVWKSPEWKPGSGFQGEGGLTPGGGLVEVADNQFAVFEDIDVKADVKPTPEKLPLRYDWTVAPGGICGIPGGGQELRLNCSQTGTYTVGLSVRDSENSILGKASRAVSVTVSQEDLEKAKGPVVALRSDKGALKTGETAVIRAVAQGGKPPYTYRWGDGVEGKGETVRLSPKKSGVQKITLEVGDSAGKKAAAHMSIMVETAKLEVTLKAAKTDLKWGEAVDIRAEAKGGEAPFAYAWGPDVAGKGDSLSYTAKKGGAQTLSVEVTDGAGQKARATVALKVEAPKLEVALKADRTTLKTGETISLQAVVKGGEPPVTHKWSPEALAKGETATFTPKKSGPHKITVEVSDDAKQTAKAGIDLKVEPLKLEVSLKADKTTLKPGETAEVQAVIKGGEPPFVNAWGSGVEGKGETARFVADKPGVRKASLTVSDRSGQRATASLDLKVEVPKLEVTLSADKSVLKTGETGTVKAEVKGGMPEYAYQWSSFVSGKEATALFTPTRTGTYKVWLEVRDKLGTKVSASLDWKVEADGGDGKTSQVGLAEKIAIEPKGLKLVPGETQPLQVLRVLPDGRKEPFIQGKVSWSVAPAEGIVISEQGTLQATSLAKIGSRAKITAKAGPLAAEAWVEVISPAKPPAPPSSAPTTLIIEPNRLLISSDKSADLKVFTVREGRKIDDVTSQSTLMVSPGSGIRIDRNGRVSAEKNAVPGAVEPLLATLKQPSGATLRADGIIRIEGSGKVPAGGYDPRTDPGKLTTAKPEDLDKVTKLAADFQKGQWTPLDEKLQKVKDQPPGTPQPPEYLGTTTKGTAKPQDGKTEPGAPPPGTAGTPPTTTSTTSKTPTTTATKTATTAGSTPKDLTDVTVDRRDVTVTVWDHGTEDGDIINIYLNGGLLKSQLRLTKKKQSFRIQLTGGQNRFEVEAVNEGSTPPNTATVEISNVTKGKPNQVYERKTGQRASMNLNAP